MASDISAPAVLVTSAANGATLSGTVTVSASAEDDMGVDRVEFYRDGVLMGTSGVAPYSCTWDTKSLANGTYQVTVKAYDEAGNSGQSASVVVKVKSATTTATITLTPHSSLPHVPIYLLKRRCSVFELREVFQAPSTG